MSASVTTGGKPLRANRCGRVGDLEWQMPDPVPAPRPVPVPRCTPNRIVLANAAETAEEMVRAVASRLHLPGRDRLDLHRAADVLAWVLARDGRR